MHLNNDKASFPADDYPFSLGYVRIIKDGADTLIAYDVDGFNNDYSSRTITRLINVNPTDLTPENFIIGSAEKNYGFQRNGAVLSILDSDENGNKTIKLDYGVDLLLLM